MKRPQTREQKQIYGQHVHERYLPYRLILSFAMLGIAMLFIALMLAFLFSRKEAAEPVPFPKLFLLSTLLLGGSSIALQKARNAFMQEKRTRYARLVMITLILGLAFMAGQIGAWYVLHRHGIFVNAFAAASYLYLLTGLHAVHIFAGVAIMLLFALPAWRYTRNDGTALYYFSDPARLLHLDLLRIYWHFLAAIWGLLLLFLLLGAGLI